MKFIVEAMGRSGARLGVLSEFGGGSAQATVEQTFETPMCFVYTRRGCVPHLTQDVLRRVSDKPLPMVFPLVHLTDFYESVKKFGGGLAEFVSIKDHIVYTAVQDSMLTTPKGYNDKNGVALWPITGRKQVTQSRMLGILSSVLFATLGALPRTYYGTPIVSKLDVEKFMNIQEAFRPHMYQALCDSDTDKHSSKKRIWRSVERTIDYLDECLERQSRCDALKHSSVFGTVEGGHDAEARKTSARLTAERPVAGFVIDGFHAYGPESENLKIEEIKALLIDTLEILPKDKPRLFHGVWRPDNVILAVELGIDLFDASYPVILSERGSAFVLPCMATRAKPLDSVKNGENDTEACIELDLTNKKYNKDLTPILDGCICYACRNFTRAYVHHLLDTSEMLAQVLLSVHNLHHYLVFFEDIRRALREERFEELKSHVLGKR